MSECVVARLARLEGDLFVCGDLTVGSGERWLSLRNPCFVRIECQGSRGVSGTIFTKRGEITMRESEERELRYYQMLLRCCGVDRKSVV